MDVKTIEISVGGVGSFVSDELHCTAFLQGWTNTNQQQNSQSDAFMEVPVLHCNGHQQATDEQHVRVFQVFDTDLKQITQMQKLQQKYQKSKTCVTNITSFQTADI